MDGMSILSRYDTGNDMVRIKPAIDPNRFFCSSTSDTATVCLSVWEERTSEESFISSTPTE